MHVEFKDHLGERMLTSWLQRKGPSTKPVVQLDSRKTQMMQIRLTNTWIARIHLMSLCHCILLIMVLLLINQGLLTCRTVRTKNRWQYYRSQGSRPYDQEELPCCDKVHQATSDTVSADPFLFFQQFNTVGADMLKYELELCFYHPAQFGDRIMKPTGTDEKPAQEITATSDAATVQHENLIAPLLVPTPNNYHVPIWRLILNKDLGWYRFKIIYQWIWLSYIFFQSW